MNTEHKEAGAMSVIEYGGKRIAVIGSPPPEIARNSIRLENTLRSMAMQASIATTAIGLFSGCLPRRYFRDYSPCIRCGNRAKGGYCFKCQKKDGVA